MKKTFQKKLLITIFAMSLQPFLALSYVGHVTLLKRSAQISLGGGLTSTNKLTKTNSNLLGDYEALGNIYVPIIGTGWNSQSRLRTSLGLTLGTSVVAGSNITSDKITFPPYRILGQSKTPVLLIGSEKAIRSALQPQAGLQANIHIGSLSISPSILISRVNILEPSRTVNQEISINGTPKTIVVEKQTTVITKGITTMPKLKLTYWLNNRVGLWLEGSSISGPTITTELYKLVPLGVPNSKGEFLPEQLLEGTLTNKNLQKQKHQSVGAGIGLTIAIGQKQNYIGHVTLLR